MSDIQERDVRIDVYQQAGGRCDWMMRMIHIPSGTVAESDIIPGKGRGVRSRFSVKTELLGKLRREVSDE